ncbi:MAG TPA: Hsp70 family protein [Candidatus Xenobia bacterium]|jgi:molecular chaperone DnaK (HSP70)
MSDSPYVIGIDLGTTNCAVASADLREATDDKNPPLHTFEIPQVVSPGSVLKRRTLPSFLYLPHPAELPEGAIATPWNDNPMFAVGEFARDQGTKTPQRLVSSAKSYLSTEGMDRRDDILPWGAPEDVPRLSPIAAEAHYLSHLKEAWNAEHEARFEDQDIVLCVPASFDAVARDLTVEAAKDAGLDRIILLEEPQAAFYSWLESQHEWRKQVKPGDIVLVCDIGGGTTDFSLISVRDKSGDLELERIAVGDHILLGGDNMDLALAASVAQRLRAEGTRLDSWQMQVLAQGCRVAKEQLMGASKNNKSPLVVPGRGSSLIGGSVNTQLNRDEIRTVVLDGFFPENAIYEHAMRPRRVGLQEIGLPYEADPAITRHLAKFLALNLGALERLGVALKPDQNFVHPTAILFNGGVLKTELLRHRVTNVINSWLKEAGAPEARILEGPELDLAVARGAAQYALVRHGKGLRIRGGTARTYYIGLESATPAVPGLPPPLKALCVVPYGMEEGSSVKLPAREFGLIIGEPAHFPFLASSTRRKDTVGTVVEDWEDDIQELTNIQATLDSEDEAAGKVVPVQLESRVTEVGTLELWCLERQGEGRWKLEFDVREKEPVS